MMKNLIFFITAVATIMLISCCGKSAVEPTTVECDSIEASIDTVEIDTVMVFDSIK